MMLQHAAWGEWTLLVVVAGKLVDKLAAAGGTGQDVAAVIAAVEETVGGPSLCDEYASGSYDGGLQWYVDSWYALNLAEGGSEGIYVDVIQMTAPKDAPERRFRQAITLKTLADTMTPTLYRSFDRINGVLNWPTMMTDDQFWPYLRRFQRLKQIAERRLKVDVDLLAREAGAREGERMKAYWAVKDRQDFPGKEEDGTAAA
jgi:hypothetical protein